MMQVTTLLSKKRTPSLSPCTRRWLSPRPTQQLSRGRPSALRWFLLSAVLLLILPSCAAEGSALRLQAKPIGRKLVDTLQELIQHQTFCFVSGTYILHDEGNHLYDLLNAPEAKERRVAKTHKKICKLTSPGVTYPNDVTQKELTFDPKIKITCPTKSRKIGVVMFYRFQVHTKRKSTDYLFVKMESCSTTGGKGQLILHGLRAAWHYTGGSISKLWSKKALSRRESDTKKKNICPSYKDAVALLNKTESSSRYDLDLDSLRKECTEYDTNARTGAELFVPQLATDYVVKKLKGTSGSVSDSSSSSWPASDDSSLVWDSSSSSENWTRRRLTDTDLLEDRIQQHLQL